MPIRKLLPTDAGEYFRLRLEGLQSFPEAFGESAEEFEALDLQAVAERIATRSHQTACILGHFDEDEVLRGTVGLQGSSRQKMQHTALLWGFYVARESRGQGLGQKLVETLLSEARSWQGLEQIKLSVSSRNEGAMRLYRSFGFETFGVEPRALKLGDEYFDEDHMMLWLGRGFGAGETG
ncbi:MAG: GNAT family N-acetyltransferase [Deltaproteobacteria bacterium]|nr:GNAT family N-acetyltransferase [Deltaproteobacteria bacterium]